MIIACVLLVLVSLAFIAHALSDVAKVCVALRARWKRKVPTDDVVRIVTACAAPADPMAELADPPSKGSRRLWQRLLFRGNDP